MRQILLWTLLSAAVLDHGTQPAKCTGNPAIRALSPATGLPHTVVDVDGEPLVGGGAVRWQKEGDRGQQTLASGMVAKMFSVPDGSQGTYKVWRVCDRAVGTGVTFTVGAAPAPAPAPRLDRISLDPATTFLQTGNGQWDTYLYVQGANVDVGATVSVNGSVKPALAHQWTANDQLGILATDLDYPIRHYLALVVYAGKQQPSATLSVQVINDGGQRSGVLYYTLPASQADRDSDGDDIPDDWEKNGYTAPNGTRIDLAKLGADYLQPDVLIEVDTMTGLTYPPDNTVFDVVKKAFAGAPIMSPDASRNGVSLIVDVQSVPNRYKVDFYGSLDPRVDQAANAAAPGAACTDAVLPPVDEANGTYPSFLDFKRVCFDNATRGRLFHYCVWGVQATYTGDGGGGFTDFMLGYGGDDCLIAVDAIPPDDRHTTRYAAEYFMHELGHLLNQRHGGLSDYAHNPAYHSLMSYGWAGRVTWQDPAIRLLWPACGPLYYGRAGAVETPAGDVPPGLDPTLFSSFSEGMGRVVDEGHLNENKGVCGFGVDWDGNPITTNPDMPKNLNDCSWGGTGCNNITGDKWLDFANWAAPALFFGGPRCNGSLLHPGDVGPPCPIRGGW